mgnify:FL=1
MTAANASNPSRPLLRTLVFALVAVGFFWGITRILQSGAPAGSREEEERAAIRMANLQQLQEANEAALTQYNWVDKEKGIVRLPINVAMEAVIPELNARKPAPAYPIATPEPATEPAAEPAAPDAAPDATATAESEVTAPETAPPATAPETEPAPQPEPENP